MVFLCFRNQVDRHTDFGSDLEQCNNKQLISSGNRCDKLFHCWDRSDESDCKKLPEESNTFIPVSCTINASNNYKNHSESGNSGFQCGPNKCLDLNYWCNKNLFKFAKAELEVFKLECKSLIALLDNDDFCKNQSFWSNKSCNKQKSKQGFRNLVRCRGNRPGQCVDPKVYFHAALKCDNYTNKNIQQTKNVLDLHDGQRLWSDCIDKSNLFECPVPDCQSENFHLCKDSKRCIHKGLICDGHDNCLDASDEEQEMCKQCPRESGHPFGRSKSATFSCLHRFTNKTICAVLCDGIDDLCKDYSDELCDSEPMEKIIGVVVLIFCITILIGESTIIMHVFKSKKSTYSVKQCHQNFPKEILLFSGQEKDCETLSHYKLLQPMVNEIFEAGNQVTKKKLVLSLLSRELCYHGPNIICVFICIKTQIEATDEALHFFKIVEEMNGSFFNPRAKKLSITENYRKLADFFIRFFQNFKKLWTFFLFTCQFSIAVFGFSFDLVKDIGFLVLLFHKLGSLKLFSYELTICCILTLSIIWPLACNLLLVLNFQSSKHNLWIFLAPLTFLFPIAPCIAIYICHRLDYSMKRLDKNSERYKDFLGYSKILRSLCFQMKLNENSTENPVQILILLSIICIDFSKTSTVTGLQNLFVGGEVVLIVLSLIWSFFSMMFGHVRWMVAKKKSLLSIYGMTLHGIFVVLTLTERIFAILIFFSPSLGLFDLLGHWTMGKVNFKNNTQLEISINEMGNVSETEKKWLPIENYIDLTVWPVKIYFFVATALFILHIIFTALIKRSTTINFISNKSKLEKMLHLITQITCPLSYPDWDEGIKSEEDANKNWKKVTTQMKYMLSLFCTEHIIMTIPIWILSYNIYIRNQYLDVYFPQVIEEQRSTVIACTLSILLPIVYIIIMFVKYQIFVLYHRHGHPWSMILKALGNPEAYNRIVGLAQTTHSNFEMENDERCELSNKPQISLNIKEQAVNYTKHE